MTPLLFTFLLGLQQPAIAEEYVPAPTTSPAAQTPDPAQNPPNSIQSTPSSTPTAPLHTPTTPVRTQAAPFPAQANLKPLGFLSHRFKFHWDRLIPLNVEVDGLKLNSIFFNRREVRSGLLKGADFGTRAEVEVTNTAKTPRIPGFVVAVFDEDGKLLGAASGGTKIGTVPPGNTETFQMNFRYVLERLPKGASFMISVELKDSAAI